MSSEQSKPYKYLYTYPFSVLNICKFLLIGLYSLSLYGWHTCGMNDGKHPGGVTVAILDLLALAFTLISLWFVVQKFYWKKVEIIFDLLGAATCVFAILVIGFSSDPLNHQIIVSHTLTLLTWVFSSYFCWRETKNNVSNLFIAEWGQSTQESEIECLEQHF